MPTWLVTGGAGFIGGNFVLDAVSAGRARGQPRCADLRRQSRHAGCRPGQSEPRVRAGRHRRCAPWSNACWREHRPDAVINFAAESHVDRSIDGPAAFVQTNVVGTLNAAGEGARLLEVAGRAGARCVPLPARLHRRGLRLARRHRQVHRERRRTRRTRRTRHRRRRPTIWCAPSTTPTACRC